MKSSFKIETTSFFLHVFAMAAMLCDHLWATVVRGSDWLNCVGRLAFPIFAFLLVEGYFHTKNLRKYAVRLFLFALISEIPFNLVASGGALYPYHQNVLWTFLISLWLIHWNEKYREKLLWLRIVVGCGSAVLGYVAGLLTMVDYYHAGVLTVLVFYFFRHKKWWCYLGQLVCLWYIHVEMLGGIGYEFAVGNGTFFLPRQGLALLSLLPVWLYRGRQGHHSRPFQYVCYAFYPLHLLILGLAAFL